MFRAIWTTLRRAHGRSIFHARSLAHRDAQQNGDAYLAVQAGLTASTLIIARSGFFLSCGSIPLAQCETGTTIDCGIRQHYALAAAALDQARTVSAVHVERACACWPWNRWRGSWATAATRATGSAGSGRARCWRWPARASSTTLAGAAGAARSIWSCTPRTAASARPSSSSKTAAGPGGRAARTAAARRPAAAAAAPALVAGRAPPPTARRQGLERTPPAIPDRLTRSGPPHARNPLAHFLLQ